MSDHDDRAYLTRRADQEWRAAACAPQPQARSIHLELAERYAERLSRLDGPALEAMPVRRASA